MSKDDTQYDVTIMAIGKAITEFQMSTDEKSYPLLRYLLSMAEGEIYKILGVSENRERADNLESRCRTH